MTLTLHFHPLASFCHKVLIALYENGTGFEPVIVNLGDPASSAAFKAIWPLAKMPVLMDAERAAPVAESTIIIDYLDAFHPGPIRFIPADPKKACTVRFWDRFFDNYVHEPMQKIVGDALRPKGSTDPFGVEQARALLRQSHAYLENAIGGGPWMDGENFTLADCSAAPALFYANTVEPFGREQTKLRAYLGRLMARASYARVLDDAAPFFGFFPLDPKPTLVPPEA